MKLKKIQIKKVNRFGVLIYEINVFEMNMGKDEGL